MKSLKAFTVQEHVPQNLNQHFLCLAKRRIWAPRLVCGRGVGTRNIFVMLLMYLWSPKHCICIVRYDVFVADPRHICRLITNGTRGGAAKRALGLPSYLWTQTPLRSRNLANKI